MSLIRAQSTAGDEDIKVMRLMYYLPLSHTHHVFTCFTLY